MWCVKAKFTNRIQYRNVHTWHRYCCTDGLWDLWDWSIVFQHSWDWQQLAWWYDISRFPCSALVCHIINKGSADLDKSEIVCFQAVIIPFTDRIILEKKFYIEFFHQQDRMSNRHHMLFSLFLHLDSTYKLISVKRVITDALPVYHAFSETFFLSSLVVFCYLNEWA